MNTYEKLQIELTTNPKTWLVTGVAGFIGSNLLEQLLKLNQNVIGLDNFATGYKKNLDDVNELVSSRQWDRFMFLKGDVRSIEDCKKACKDVDYVLHQAALGSVPRSLEDPITTNETNVMGFLNMLVAAKDAKVKSFTYAASSSTYGDEPNLPKIEDKIGKPLSPYAVTKYVNEIYSEVFNRCYGFNTVGLRYFNVFGPRQAPDGPYAAVIPKWINAMIKGDDIFINGKGNTSRDFTYVKNVVQANLLSATTNNVKALNEIYNIALGKRTNLSDLYKLIKNNLSMYSVVLKDKLPTYIDYRSGDVLHSQASIEKATLLLGYYPTETLEEGLKISLPWYLSKYCSII